MFIAFTDESYSDKRYIQCAYIIQEEKVSLLNQILLEASIYAQGFGISTDVEFHGHSIMSSAKGWEPLRNNIKAKFAIYRFVLRKISETGGILLIQGVDIKRLNNRYNYPDPPHEITHKHLLEAIDRFATAYEAPVIVYSDQTETEERLSQLFRQYQTFTTGGPFPRRLGSILDVQFAHSHHHAGIQIADLCVYLYRRLVDHAEGNPITKYETEKMWEILKPNIHPQFQPRIWTP